MADNFGLKIGLEGEKEFKKALADINQSFKVLGSEMKVVQSQFDKNDDSVEALTARNQVLGKEIDTQKKKIETLRKALENASTSFGENDRRTQQWQIQLNNAQAALNNMERELDQNQRAIDSMGDEMRDAAQQTDKFGDEIDDAADKTDKASGKLEKVGSVLKGLAVTAGAAVAAAGAALAGLTKSFLDLAESTREYREDQAKLDAAFTTAGFTAEQAGEAYTGFYAILGEEDRSVEAVNHLAKLCSTEEELAQWTDIAAGVWATFGDSLPIEGLTEAANETAKTGTITGQLADALNWAGVNEEAFQSALDGCSSEQERAALITDTLNGLYQEAAENYKTLNGDVMEAQRAQALLTDAYAQLGAIAEPIMTTLKTMAADVLTAMIPFVSLMGEGLQGVLNGTAGAAETFAEGISGLVSVLMEMVRDALDGKIDLIVTKSVSRFARNTVDSLVTVRKLKEKGVEVYFEKENIYTLDSKGELLITIMSSLAQEESRSISENVTWGQRKRFADGKVSLPYSHFLGYRKGADGLPEIVPEEAETVRWIYSLFLSGKTTSSIASFLTREGIPTPAGKKRWAASTVESILKNEKYKGDALLQKTFTVDFLTKKQKKNEGEVPQYYVENSHPAIIDPAEWKLVQRELERRKAIGRSYSGNSFFSSRLVCGDCGGYFGSKVWHSTDKYRRTIWRCNSKFTGEEKCQTPHLTEEEIKARFLDAFNTLVSDKERLLDECRTMQAALTDTGSLDSEISALLSEMEVVAELTKRCIEENSTTAQDQATYLERYNGLAERYETAKAKLEKLQATKAQREAKAEDIGGFMFELAEYGESLTEFDDRLWLTVIDIVTVHRDGRLTFKFQTGHEMLE